MIINLMRNSFPHTQPAWAFQIVELVPGRAPFAPEELH